MTAQLTRINLDSLPTHVRRALDGIEALLVYSIPMTTRFRRVTSRDGLLLRGSAGWGEAAPFWDYEAAESALWLRAALEEAREGVPAPIRDRVPVNVTIPVQSPEAAYERVVASGECATAKVKVADPGSSLAQDVERIEAVADALYSTVGSTARLRVDANAAWDKDEAVASINELNAAAAQVGGLEYVEQPCPTVEDLAAVRRRVDVPIAADESIRRAEDPIAVARAEAADIAVIKVAPLAGPSRALQIAADTGLDVVISSALETSVGLSIAARTAAALPGELRACGLATAQLLAADVVTSPLIPKDGQIGVDLLEPDLALVDSTPCELDIVGRWIGRLDAMSMHLLAREAK
ncbi:o-succinylbenzoate synthase [Schaalia vaccimaxillae]|uniref:o-succinylbenzoate synthase n=1 Tax=Schaalia vaccimaxillae TaxID=183916 RepID=UPI0003B4383C|nr:o-succinylbenzoate synthase [Schaalia vaccimaxillae]